MWLKVYLNVPSEDNDVVKRLGAKFDSKVKKWYYHPNEQSPASAFYQVATIHTIVASSNNSSRAHNRCVRWN
jgi:hypothetical protein